VEVIEHCGGSVSEDTGLVDAELIIAAGLTRASFLATRGQLRNAEHAEKERVLACDFLRGSDRIRYMGSSQKTSRMTSLWGETATRRPLFSTHTA
jgi:hypothetical protein